MSAPVRSEFNITPLVDVVLVLLIIFMVLTPMLHRGKDVKLPPGAGAPPGPPALTVTLLADGQLFVENAAASMTMLEAQLRAAPRLVVRADEQVEYCKLRGVLALAQRTRLRGVSLAARGR